MKITLRDLPKISLNKWYSGSHWSERKRIKDNYKLIIISQLKPPFWPFKANKSYLVHYSFFFKGSPLDATNCAAMVKLIEDVLFEDDNYKIIPGIGINTNKSKDNYVEIEIIEL
jgi:hypothetical protein